MSFRRIITEIPAPGDSIILRQSGNAVQVESIPVYTDALQVPLIQFDTDGERQPIYPASIYTGAAQQVTGVNFNQIIITGTTQSAGDRLILLVTDSCLSPEINTNSSEITRQESGITFTVPTTDTAVSLLISQLTSASGKLAVSALISARNNGVKFAFGVNPTVAGIGHLLATDEKIRIDGVAFLQNIRFVNAVSAANANVDISLSF